MAVMLDALYDPDLMSTLKLWQQTPNRRVIMAHESDGWRFAVVLMDARTSSHWRSRGADEGIAQWVGSREVDFWQQAGTSLCYRHTYCGHGRYCIRP
jgi:hypothetical protein